MAIKEAALAAFIASSAATIEKQDTDQAWKIQEDENAVVLRAYHKASETHLLMGCTAGSPVSLLAHRKDGKEGWYVNLKVDSGESIQYGSSGLGNDAVGIVYAQINTEQSEWKHLMTEMEAGGMLKVLTDFSNGSTLSRYPLKGFSEKYQNWLTTCEDRGWIF